MAAGLRAVMENAAVIDAVVEVRDARLPRATAATGLHPTLARKRRLIALNREDLADPAMTDRWLAALGREGIDAFATIGTHAGSIKSLRSALFSKRPRDGRLRVAVVGAPNTGKSSIINALGRRKRAAAQDRAGITRHVRWLRLAEGVDILDTPGVLPPRIIDEASAWQLALCGCLPETAYDPEEVVAHFEAWVRRHRPGESGDISLASFARQHGMIRRGGELDGLNAARKFISRFRAGAFMRVTFEPSE
jgi:ribosome biogenesis GTPase A